MPRFVNRILRLKFPTSYKQSQNSSARCYSSVAAASTKISQEPILDDKSLWVASHLPDVQLLDDVTMPEYFRANVGKWGNSPAYECAETGRKYTHNKVYGMSRSFAAALIKSKQFSRGDAIGVVLQNIPEYCSVIFGIWEAGLIASPINPSYTNEEIARQLLLSGAKAAITTPEFLKVVREAANTKAGGSIKSIIVIGEPQQGCHSFYEMAKSDTWGVEFTTGSQIDTKNDTCYLPFSSGTTGNPKGVELTHYCMLSNVLQISGPGMSNIKKFENEHQQERFVGLLPMFHIYGLGVFVYLAMTKGAHVMCMPKYNPDTFLRVMRTHKPTALHLVTPLINHITNCPDFGPEELREVTTIVGGAAPIGQTLINKLYDKAKNRFVFQEGYGMTELSPVSHMLLPSADISKLGSCGGPVPNTVTKLVDVSTGKTVGRNERGEVWVKGPQVMKGYYNNEKATKECLDDEGWLRTGDIGYYDSEGYLFIVDRLKELIKVKGLQVAPSELEDLLRDHPDISDVAVIGVPNEEWGELPRASIVKKNKSLSEDDIHNYVKPKVAHFKQLRGGIDFRKEIPKAPSGKILRKELLKEYKEKNGLL